MPIEVRYYQNLFWAEGNVKPNRIPDPQKRDLLSRQPRMYDFSNGYIKLYGLWNYAIYEGRHYFLDILYRFDEKRQSYGYAMRLDVWSEALRKKPILRGILNVSNDDNLLNEHLQYTYPTLLEPANSRRINFVEKDFDWRTSVIKKKAPASLKQYVVTADAWHRFINAHRSEHVQAYCNDWAKNFFNDPGTDAIYIFDYLRLGSLEDGWKSWIINKVNKFLDELGDNHKIAKCTTPANSALVGKYCITSKIEGIGGGEENVNIDLIDLSGLKDIVEVRAQDLGEILLAESDFSLETAIFNFESEHHDKDFGLKVCRKFYGSFAGKGQKGEIRGAGLGSWAINETDHLYWDENRRGNYCAAGGTYAAGQGGGGSYCSDKRRDPIFFNWGKEDTVQFLKFKTEAAGVEEHVRHGITYWVDRLNFTLDFSTDSLLLAIRENVPNDKLAFPSPGYIVDNSRYSYLNEEYFRSMKNAPGYGFLIFQTIRPWTTWDTIEYKGDVKLTNLKVITGINNTFNREYGNDKLRWLPRLVDESTGLRGNMGVLLFYLDYFSFLHFTPANKAYAYGYGDQEWVDAFKLSSLTEGNLTWYITIDTKLDLNLNGEKIKNPFTEGRYAAHSQKRVNILNNVTIQEELDLKEFDGLQKGDYFFTDLEYALSDIRHRNPREFLNSGENPWYRTHTDYRYKDDNSSNRRSIGVLSDFVRRPEEENSQHYFDSLENTLILCSTKDKKIEVRLFEYFQKHHYLDNSSRQILYTVNNKTEQQIKYIKLKNLGIEIDPTKQEITDEVKLRILKLFYESNNYKVEGNKWSWVSVDDLRRSPRDRIFDLVGTQWYVHVKKGKISLIAKDQDKEGGKRFEELFKPKKQKINTIEPVKELENLTLLEKVNQRCFLNIYTETRPIRAKFDFSKLNRFDITLQTPKPSRLQTGSNYYILQIKDKFDVIDREVLAIPKLPTDSVDIATSVQIEQQRLLALRAKQDYELATGRLEIREGWIEEEYRRKGWDLNMQKWKFGINAAGQVVETAARVATAYGKYEAMAGLAADIPDYLGQFSAYPAFQEGAADAVTKTLIGYEKAYLGSRNRAASQALSTGVGIVTQALTFAETQKRADYNREMAVRGLNISKTQTALMHERAKQDSMLNINSLSNVYRKGLVNDMVLVEEMNKDKNLNDGQEMNPVHLVVYTPSEEQLKYLVDHKERHGIDCFIPNQTYKFFFGMNPDVIRFKDLYSEDIQELDLPELRKAFLAMIYAGVKIVNIEEAHLIEETEEEKLTAELTVEKSINKRLETQNHDLTEKVEEVTHNYEQEKQKTTELTTQKEELEKDKNKLQTDLTAATNRADTLSNSVHRLEGELTTEKNVKNLLQAEVNKMRPELAEVKQKNQDLTKKIIDLGIKVHNLTNQIAALTNQKITWTYEGDPATGAVNLDQSLHNLNNQIEALGKFSTAINTDTTHLNEQIASLTRALDECRTIIPKNPYALEDQLLLRKLYFFWAVRRFKASFLTWEKTIQRKMQTFAMASFHIWFTFPRYYRQIKQILSSDRAFDEIVSTLEQNEFWIQNNYTTLTHDVNKNPPNLDKDLDNLNSIPTEEVRLQYNYFCQAFFSGNLNLDERANKIYKIFETLFNLILTMDSYSSGQKDLLKNKLRNFFTDISYNYRMKISAFTYSYFTDNVEYGIVYAIWAWW